MKKLIGINTWFNNGDENVIDNYTEIGFRNNLSLLDYDAVILNTYGITDEYETEKLMGEPKLFQGIKVLDRNESFTIKREFELLKKQLVEMLKAGRNVYVLLDKNEPRYAYSGKETTSGTGRNLVTTNYIELLDNYGFLPVSLEVEELVGDKMMSVGEGIWKQFFDKISEKVYYRQIICKPKGTPIASIVGTTKVVSMYMEYEKGKIIFLPCPYEAEEYENEAEGIQKRIALLNNIKQLDADLSVLNEVGALPEWTDAICILNEKEQKEKLKKIEDKIEKALLEKQKVMQKIEELKKYKYLLTESGIALEECVKNVLTELGFVLLETEANRSDIIALYDDMSVVIEVKGLSKSAGEKNAAQLEKWVSEYFVNEGKHPKGILVVNGFRNKNIDQRDEDVFPKQMLPYSESRAHCLISTTQLLCLYIASKREECKKEELVREFINTVGVYNKFTDVDKYLK